MNKKVLSEISLYHGDVLMPIGFEIDQEQLTNNILQSCLKNKELQFSIPFDMLNTYIREHINLKFGFTLINKKTWGNIYKPNELNFILQNVDPVDLKNSPDYTLLYGVVTNNCSLKIFYDDNRRKGRNWEIPLTTNKFIMFPSTCPYSITNTQKDSLNFIQTITYEFI